MGGARHAVLLQERDWLLARIAAAPDLTITALRAELIERGTRVSRDAFWRFLAKERQTFQKKACAPPSRTGLTLLIAAPAGGATNSASRLRGWSSSMKPGPRPT